MNDLTLPEPITAYFAADLTDAHAVARCFTPDGCVLDEGKAHVGRAAIEAWKAAASTRYRYTTTPRRLEQHGGVYVVTSHVSGEFPDSPVDLRYTFTLKQGRIAMLEIAP